MSTFFVILAEVTLSYELYLPTLQDPPNWDDILRHFRGSELQKYFTRLLEDKMKVLLQLYLLEYKWIGWCMQLSITIIYSRIVMYQINANNCAIFVSWCEFFLIIFYIKQWSSEHQNFNSQFCSYPITFYNWNRSFW